MYKQTSSKVNTDNLIKITNQNDRSLHQNITISHINARSLIPKITSFQEYIMSKDSNLCLITETWLKRNNETAHKSIPPDGYKIILPCRTNGRHGGGIALIYKELLKANEKRGCRGIKWWNAAGSGLSLTLMILLYNILLLMKWYNGSITKNMIAKTINRFGISHGYFIRSSRNF